MIENNSFNRCDRYFQKHCTCLKANSLESGIARCLRWIFQRGGKGMKKDKISEKWTGCTFKSWGSLLFSCRRKYLHHYIAHDCKIGIWSNNEMCLMEISFWDFAQCNVVATPWLHVLWMLTWAIRTHELFVWDINRLMGVPHHVRTVLGTALDLSL